MSQICVGGWHNWVNAALWAATNSPTAQACRVKSGHRRLWRSGAEPGHRHTRDSGLDISPCRKEAIAEKRAHSGVKRPKTASKVRYLRRADPQADLVVGLTPDKQHSDVVRSVQPLMKDGAALGYSRLQHRGSGRANP
ncbi:hypothetical protein KCP78_19705 [Salmonella enterica subsp. enterica]|nr:hypothetical protein KCP78_19705 [Salmonella enterica subsp. enterica]